MYRREEVAWLTLVATSARASRCETRGYCLIKVRVNKVYLKHGKDSERNRERVAIGKEENRQQMYYRVNSRSGMQA